MQSILQYRRFGKLAEEQLAADPEKGLGSRNRNFRNIKDFSANGNGSKASVAGDEVSMVSSQDTLPNPDRPRETHEADKPPINPSADPLNRSVTTEGDEDDTSDVSKAIIVGFQPENDPMNPREWSFGKRLMVTIVVSFMGVIVGWSSSIDSGIIPQYAEEFGVSEVVASLPTGLFLVGFGTGAVMSGPFSETVGRNPIYIITLIVFMLLLVGAGLAQNLAGQLVSRTLAGIFAATPLACAGGTIADVWTPEGQVFAFPIYAIISFSGPVLGPVVGGWVGQSNLSWRWTEWVTLIGAGVILVIVIFFQPETYSPILLKWKATHLRRVTGDDRYRAEIELRQASLLARLLLAMYRPVIMLIQEPTIFLFSLYLTVAYIIIFTFFTGYEFIYEGIYGLTQGETALCFLGLAIGLLLCIPLIPLNVKLRSRDITRTKETDHVGKAPPESRLYWAMVGAPALPISMFWMAWTARPDIPFWSPLAASVLTGFGMLCIFITCYQYLIDTYGAYAASALSSLTLMRYLVSGAMIEVSIPFYKNMGVPYTLTILGCISAVLVPIPYVFYRYGPEIRKRSRYGGNSC
ncbi:major facilitator superfamily domain-containing protein [Aspergillus novoparasiticus]|uniref:Major facilitator superfamily domain-containing protein n=1 Tax=Aspergillus novoparasiticus TaxID=986946 RepID=A0A5N6EAJ9_9EURO|nr:major facilitator superfamily domain-containing protein [Aspergillus novoparasiticus]